jgi:hypothetical protein
VAGSGAGAAAVAARDDACIAHRLGGAERRLLEGDLELSLEIALVSATDAEHAEQITEDAVDGDVAEVDHAAGEGPAAGERGAGLLGAVTEPVVHGPTLRIAQYLVRSVQLLEAVRCFGIVRIPVGMVLRRQLAEGGLDLFRARALGYAKDLVMVALGHRFRV